MVINTFLLYFSIGLVVEFSTFYSMVSNLQNEEIQQALKDGNIKSSLKTCIFMYLIWTLLWLPLSIYDLFK